MLRDVRSARASSPAATTLTTNPTPATTTSGRPSTSRGCTSRCTASTPMTALTTSNVMPLTVAESTSARARPNVQRSSAGRSASAPAVSAITSARTSTSRWPASANSANDDASTAATTSTAMKTTSSARAADNSRRSPWPCSCSSPWVTPGSDHEPADDVCRRRRGGLVTTGGARARLRERLCEQPEAEHRVADHRDEPRELAAFCRCFVRRSSREMSVRDHDGGDVHQDDDADGDVPEEGVRQERVTDFVVVVERVRQVDRPGLLAGRVADERRHQLAVDEQVLHVVRDEVAEGDGHDARQQLGQRTQEAGAVPAEVGGGAREHPEQRQQEDDAREEGDDSERLEVRTGGAPGAGQVAFDVVGPLWRREQAVEVDVDEHQQHEDDATHGGRERPGEAAEESVAAGRAEAEVADPPPRVEEDGPHLSALEPCAAEQQPAQQAQAGVQRQPEGDDVRQRCGQVEDEL